ncbi:phytoene/squalene synthase family protein [Nocardia carnea]|uniref:phytoene/squalene synthase family protein n=1 Tax=Nocardia carnea TaxID=37328 RepID=UPI002455FBBC|nr:phytoene/squalene synthase family protein [Nocardia carnea]
MIGAELDAAGITEPMLRVAYRRCRDLNSTHGRTFFLATRLLAPAQRPAIHALYGFARWADDIVDLPDPGTESPAVRLEILSQRLFDSFRTPGEGDSVVAAVSHTAKRYALDPALFQAFLESMRMDLTVTDYPDRTALDRYVHGSAEVIGLQVLPVLGTDCPVAEAAPYAVALGKAFQLTNFLRDIAEDLDRGRVYLPADELAAFGVDRARLQWCRDHRRTDARVRESLAAQHAIARDWYRTARLGIDLLHPVSRPCVTTAAVLYGEILDRIEADDFAVFAGRAAVGRVRRVSVAGSALVRALWARRHGRARTLGAPVAPS